MIGYCFGVYLIIILGLCLSLAGLSGTIALAISAILWVALTIALFLYASEQEQELKRLKGGPDWAEAFLADLDRRRAEVQAVGATAVEAPPAAGDVWLSRRAQDGHLRILDLLPDGMVRCLPVARIAGDWKPNSLLPLTVPLSRLDQRA